MMTGERKEPQIKKILQSIFHVYHSVVSALYAVFLIENVMLFLLEILMEDPLEFKFRLKSIRVLNLNDPSFDCVPFCKSCPRRSPHDSPCDKAI
jgi:hypothetical protein